MTSRKHAISDLLVDGTDADIPPRSRARPAISLSDSPVYVSGPSQTPSIALPYPQTSQPIVHAVPFQRPQSLLTFSYDAAHTLEFTDSAMRYYVEPPPHAELGFRYEHWVRRPDEKGRLDSLLRAYSEARREGNISTPSADIGVVSWRGVMTRILTAPYEERDGWELNVMLRDGTLYLEEHLSEARLQEKNDMPPQQRQQTYYGYAFESWSTASAPDAPSGWHGDVDTNVQWCSVIKTKLGTTRMIIGGEVDCVRDRYDGKNDTMVELKTSMNIRGAQDAARFEKKLLKFYFQSFLLGVPEIIVGFRTPRGELTTLQSFKTMEIPRMIRGKPGAWDPQICLHWGDQFLSRLRDTISYSKNISEDAVWRVKFVPRVGVQIALLDDAGVEDVVAGEERVGFLPTWYWEEILGASRDAVERGNEWTADTRSMEAPSTVPIPTGWQI